MAHSYFSEYVAHAMRFYSRSQGNPDMTFQTKADRLNWECCKATLEEFPKQDRDILMDIYGEKHYTFAYCIQDASVKYGVAKDHIWRLNDVFLVAFATKRDLI